MLEEQTTPAEEVNEPEETVNDDQDVEDTEEAEATIGDLHEETEDKKVSENIPKARLDKEITRRKALEKELAELKKSEEEAGGSTPESKSEASDLEARLAAIENKDKVAKRDAAIASHIAKALENAPEFKDVANPDVIKQMVLNPLNKDKTYSQLLEEAYGNAITGKRTVETTTPRGGAQDTKLDLARAQTDTEYRREVLKDPMLKKQYNEGLETRLRL